MSDRTDAVVQALFDKPTLHDCSLQQIDYLAHQYPYFSTAQLLLLQKSDRNSDGFARQLPRAALHFATPQQLDYWLTPALFETEIPEPKLFQDPIPDISNAAIVTAQTEVGPETAVSMQPVITGPLPPLEAVALSVPEVQVTEASPKSGTLENSSGPDTVPLAFEPYHTVDYFASQGIRLSLQEATNDKLGKQLRSFTEWLKTMKRLPERTEPATETTSERNVENLAAHSLQTSDVVTESMAEVWLKQGAIEKAADVYNKLSLRDPSKSAYFAAKIEAIKHS